MAKFVAEFSIIGRLGKVDAGEKVTRISIATEENRKVDDEWETKTYWNNVTLFGKDAERAQKAEVGSTVRVTGTFNQTEWESEDGEKRYGYDFKGSMFADYGKPARRDD